MDRYRNLLSPITIGKMTMKNRMVMSPMETKLGNPDGTVSDETVAYYERRARGGVGLIIVEATYVHPLGRGFAAQLGIDSDWHIEGLARIPEAVHPYGAKVAIQLIHHGRQTDSGVLSGEQPVAPSAIPYNRGEMPRALAEEEIEALVACFAGACRRSKAAGFDAAEIHAAHGYLLQTFLSPHSNHRTDRYGADLEGRMRFPLDAITASREMVGPDFPLMVRVSHREAHEGGYETDYMENVVPHMVRAGIDLLDVSAGNYNAPGGVGIPVMDFPMGLNVEGAGRLRKAAGVPTLVVGRLNDPDLAEKTITDGSADMIVMGRQFLADPDYPKKIEEERLEDIRFCLACNDGCYLRMVREETVACSVNPECARELEFDLSPVDQPRRTWVIGAGPAGLSAAYYCALRGHRVTLWEREAKLGGQWNAASQPKSKSHMRRLINFYQAQLEKHGVNLMLGSEVTAEVLTKGDPEFVVLATGAVPGDLPLESDGSVEIVQAVDVLLDRVTPGRNVVVVGASRTGLEVADYITDKTESITIIEALAKEPVRRYLPHGHFLYQRLEEAGVDLVLNATVEGVEGSRVLYRSDDRVSRVENVDTLILATGSKSESALKSSLDEIGVKYTVIGDALEPRMLHEAIHEGARVADQISLDAA